MFDLSSALVKASQQQVSGKNTSLDYEIKSNFCFTQILEQTDPISTSCYCLLPHHR